jgi:hypothetical protein
LLPPCQARESDPFPGFPIPAHGQRVLGKHTGRAHQLGKRHYAE